jgi:copper chaperone CopZ
MKRIATGALTLLVMSMIGLAVVRGTAFAAETMCPLRIKGMHCEMCPSKVEDALKSVPGVKSAKVDYKSSTADVVIDDSVKPAQLMGAVQKAGFQAEPLKPMAASKASDPCCQ